MRWPTHMFFQKHSFLYIHTPIVTTSDCEGAGEMFQITTLIGVAQLKSAKAGKAEITASVAELNKAKENLSRLEEQSKLKPGIRQKDGKIHYSQDIFSRQTFLTVSGQLQVETYACAVSSVYTFGPTF